ncbi:hypothetical protein [Streptomyces melanogenes]|uniref:hypothetical protein n=1 Tax=Streptomyces melanogenes TaxID=67326 RepID=UPI00167DBFDF|nr:hypothetical protein [Streptomyces melanogenes]
MAPSDFDGPEQNMPQDVSASADKVAYGDLTGDHHDEAALPVLCANHNSTAAGQRAMGVMVFDGADHPLRLIGTLVGQQPRLGEPPNFLEIWQITPGKIVATETFYGPGDANCCASGKATDTWTFESGKLNPTSSVVDTPPDNG